MKKQSLKLHHRSYLHIKWYWLIWIYFPGFISCGHQSSYRPEKQQHEINSLPKHNFPPPKTIFVKTRNQPKTIKAGKPILKFDSSGVGIPFFTTYGTDQGLPVNNIICSLTDKAGNLWFGTGGGGISRYDGRKFKNYTKSQGLSGNIVFYMLEDKAANLWIGTSSGLSKYDGKKFTNYSVSDGLAGNFITCILQDNKGTLWFGTHNGGISKYNGEKFENYTMSSGLAGNYVRCMFQDKNGILWFGTDAKGVSRFDGNNFTNYTTTQGLANNSINCITQDIIGNLWFGTNAGVTRYNGTAFRNYTTIDGLADNNVYCILQDETNDLWFGTHTKGVSKFNGKKFRNYTMTDGLGENKINSIIQDKSGNVWIASQGGGVSKYEGNAFTHYTIAQGLAGNLVFYITQDKSGNLWFATYEGGVSKYDGKYFANFTKAEGLPDISIWSMVTDKAGNVWFGTDRAGVSKYDGTKFTNYTTEQGLADDAVISMMQDKAGNMWFGTRENGVSKFDGQRFTSYSKTQGLAGNNVWSIVQDNTGNIWFATHEDGVSRFDGERFTNYTAADGLPGNAVTSICKDRNGNLWFGTDGQGVSYYDGKSFTNYTTEQGLADNSIMFIAEDQTRNIIWFGTNQGLSGLKEKTFTNNNSAGNIFENYSKIAGYPVKDVSTGGMFVDNKGMVWIGSGEGKLVRFDHSALNKKNTVPLQLEIQDVRVNNETICWNNLLRAHAGDHTEDSLTMINEMFTSFGNVLTHIVLDNMRIRYGDIQFDGVTKFYPVPTNLVLPHKNNNITIDFLAIEPALPTQVMYQYKLEGYDNNWSQPGNNTSAVFGNIKGGSYVFKLKALSAFGVWSEKQYSFRVLPPWWLTWWAYTSYVLMAGAIFYAFYLGGIRRTERRQAAKINIMLTAQEEERKRISRDLHDDIGARLTNINILSALGQQKIKDPIGMSEYLKRISNEIQTSADALDDIVWSIDTKNDSIEEVTARMRRYAADIFDTTGTRYAIIVDEKFLPKKLSIGKRRDLFLIFTEAINNVQKHAMANEVTIIIKAEGNNLLMQVSDNGRGFDSDLPTHRNGLKNIRQRIQKWGGTFAVESSPAKGAMIIILLPISNPSLKRGIWDWFKNR